MVETLELVLDVTTVRVLLPDGKISSLGRKQLVVASNALQYANVGSRLVGATWFLSTNVR